MVLLTGEYISERELPTLAIAATPIKSGKQRRKVTVGRCGEEVILAALEKTGGNKTGSRPSVGHYAETLLAKLSR